MDKRTKLIASLLFVVLVILAAAVTRFYSSVPDEISTGVNQTEVSKRLETDSGGNMIFENSSGLCGVLDSRERLIVAPEWQKLSFAGNNTCIASKQIGGKTLTGCIDYEGNITVPFVYSSINRHSADSSDFYIAEADADGQSVIYDSQFRPMFRQSWTGAKFTDGKLILVDAGGIFTYTMTEEGAIFDNAKISGETLGCNYTLEVNSRILLQKLTSQVLEQILRSSGVYLEFAFSGNEDLLSQITTKSHTAFQQIFPEDHKILDKSLKGVSDIAIYSVRLEDNTAGYTVSMKADTELTYSDEFDGKTKKLRDKYTAKVTFTGSNMNTLTAVSGSFVETQPRYPQPEPEPEPMYDPVTGELILPIQPETSPQDLPDTETPTAPAEE